MEYRITINLDNAAFLDSTDELDRILIHLRQRIFDNGSNPYIGTLMDTNGNTVGKAEVVK